MSGEVKRLNQESLVGKYVKVGNVVIPKTARYFDMDGVLVDWLSRFNEVSKIPIQEFQLLSKEDKDDYKKELFTYDFFRGMKPLYRGMQLLKESSLNITVDNYILSATGKINKEDVLQAKLDWIKEYIPSGLIKDKLFVDKTEFKYDLIVDGYAGHHLIDDREKSIKPWIKNGGSGLLFV